MVNNIGNVPIETTSKLIDVQNVDSMGNSYLCVDIPLNPRFRVSQITDGSSKYGGDDMAPYKTSV